jgi:2-polyprenyl-3-methyl-5-hydroxy-6-metoxy-1,4-benzoquinol methylase
MPINIHDTSDTALLQRELYANSILTRTYWDFKDRVIAGLIPDTAIDILDLGCGEGISLENIKNALPSAEVSGIDYLNENISICRNQNLNVKQGNVYDLDIQDNSFDAVIFMEVIEHLEDPQKAIAEIHRILKPNGSLIIGFPNDHVFLIARLLLLKWKEAKYDPGHVNRWNPREMSTFLSKNGFNSIHTKCTPTGIWHLSLHGISYARKG